MDVAHDELIQKGDGTPECKGSRPLFEAAAPAPAELVLQNGRLSGARRALKPHVTVVGQAVGCDVRLDVAGVSPTHCLLVHTPAGLVLRDLHTETGTFVNGERASLHTLRDGDVLAVGPFRFKVRLPPVTALPDPEALEREKEALRIQAAAVAAQQAALTEEELRLHQSRVALEQQEAQLAAHLEEKRQRLTELRDQARQARAELQTERAAYEQRVAATAQELTGARREIAAGQRQVQAERRRLLDLRRRLKHRWHRHWAGERAAMRRREEELASLREQVEQRQERLRREKDELHQQRLRINGEAELGSRQLQAACQEFQRVRANWEQECQARQDALGEQARRLYEREVALAAVQRALAVEGQQWQERRQALQQECDGLERRIGHQRRKIDDQEREVVRLETLIRSLEGKSRPGPAVVVPALPAPSFADGQQQEAQRQLHERTAALEQLAGSLADQRLQLVEQVQRFVQAQQDWQQERDATTSQLEDLGLSLQERERTLSTRELALHTLECGLRQRQEQLDHRERSLEAWQTRLAVRTTAWEAERDHLLADQQAREEIGARRLAVLTDLRRRWHRSRRQQLERLRSERAACAGLGLEYVALREELQSRRAILEQEQRTVSEWAMAISEYRQECLDKASDATAVARHLEELRRRWAALTAAAERSLDEQRRTLQAEAARLQERQTELDRRADHLALQEVELSDRRAAWEEQQVVVQDQRCQAEQEVQRLRREGDRQERELKELREELERVARVLMDDGTAVLPLPRAA
jgi:pSer/pThr/pTyr-binding forkhead associated (FHA) protein